MSLISILREEKSNICDTETLSESKKAQFDRTSSSLLFSSRKMFYNLQNFSSLSQSNKNWYEILSTFPSPYHDTDCC
jgi:hypothetical protein